MHSPPRKVSAEEAANWKVPPCVSNWKNAKGYTIPLDKRLAADGRGLQETAINDGFAKFAEALYVAEHSAREAVELRAAVGRELASKEREAKERQLEKWVEKMLHFSEQLRRLRIDRYEYVSMKVIVLLTADTSDIKERDRVRESQEKVRVHSAKLLVKTTKLFGLCLFSYM